MTGGRRVVGLHRRMTVCNVGVAMLVAILRMIALLAHRRFTPPLAAGVQGDSQCS